MWKSLEEINGEPYISMRGWYINTLFFIIKCKEQNIRPKVKITIVKRFLRGAQNNIERNMNFKNTEEKTVAKKERKLKGK